MWPFTQKPKAPSKVELLSNIDNLLFNVRVVLEGGGVTEAENDVKNALELAKQVVPQSRLVSQINDAHNVLSKPKLSVDDLGHIYALIPEIRKTVAEEIAAARETIHIK